MPVVAPAGYKRYLYSASYIATYPDGSVTDFDDVCQSLTLCIDYAIGGKGGEAAEQLCNDTASNSFQSAIALAEQDPLLQCVSSWLNQDFDWQPVPASDSQELEPDLMPEITPDITPDITLRSAKSTRHRIGLSFRENIDRLPTFPAEYGEIVELQKHKQTVSLCLASLQLSDADVQRLKPGSLVLLPESFKDQCEVELFASPSGTHVALAKLDHRNNNLRFADDAMQPTQSAPVETGSVTRVILQQPVSIDVSRLSESHNAKRSARFGNADALVQTVVSLPVMDGQAVLVQQHHPDGVEAYGASLLRIGSGLAAVLSASD